MISIRSIRRASILVALFGGAALLAVAPARAEGDQRASPHAEASGLIGGRKVTISYGRPFKKGRKIFGGLVPYGEVWRTGADEATTLTVDGYVTIGTLKVKKGTYTLFTIPGEKEWTLVLNKDAKQWGAYSYDAAKDLGRTPAALGVASAPVEQFTIAVEPGAAGKGTLKLSWDTTVVTVGLSEK